MNYTNEPWVAHNTSVWACDQNGRRTTLIACAEIGNEQGTLTVADGVAHARLIAAAPDLLAVARCAALNTSTCNPKVTGGKTCLSCRAREVIAKIEEGG